MKTNETMMQFFEWYLPSDGTLWKTAVNEAPYLAKTGITQVWFPPAYKGNGGKDDVGYGVYEEYVKNTGDTTKTILLSTASPYKFPESVYQALTGEEVDVYTAIEKLHDLTGMEISYPLKGIKDREILHKGVIDRDAILDTIAEKIKEY